MSEVRRLRADNDTISALLERASSQSDREVAESRRATERFDFRVRALIVEFPSSMGMTRYVVPARDISRDGLSFLIGNFVYPGAPCRVKLVSEYNQSFTIDATVVRCKYLVGSTNIYDVGVKLKNPIDVAMFHRAATRMRVLLADGDPAVARLFTHFLAGMNAELTVVASGREAVDVALAGQFEVILMDIDMPELDGLGAVKELRSRGCVRPILACTASADDDAKNRCREAGFTDFITKPVAREQLTRILESLKVDAIVSTLIHDISMAPLIDEFVAGIPAQIGNLEAALGAEDIEGLERQARALKGTAGSYGFGVITDAATELEQLAHDKADPAAMRVALNELAALCLAARPATCADA